VRNSCATTVEVETLQRPTSVVESYGGLPMGSKLFDIKVNLHRIKCKECGSYLTEQLDFLPEAKVHYTKQLARTIIELRPEMTIQALAKHFGLSWNTVKEIEKRYLKKKYKKVKLNNVKYIGIDEIHIGNEGFLTIVRDLESGSVLHIGDGKGADALSDFTKRLRLCKVKLEAISLDFGRVYIKWAKEAQPQAKLIFDHFHLIKLMNDKLDKIRRTTIAKLEEEEMKQLKNKRWLFLKNIENLEDDSKEELENLRSIYDDLGTASMLKELLRNIYSIAEYDFEAEIAFDMWCKKADETGISYLKTMAKTIRKHIKGIVAYWNTGITNAFMEGFNNKIRWLNKQAYGYRDIEYLKLKIFDLPKAKDLKL
jgi:transposase